MSPIIACSLAFLAYFIGYRFYSKFLSTRLFELRADAKTPAHQYADGIDFVATKPPVLFGHHYASITGLAPMLGPAIAVIWGWAPALMWVVLGEESFCVVIGDRWLQLRLHTCLTSIEN